MLTAATPYLVPGGQLVSLGARLCGAETFELCCASGSGEWRGFADLRVSPVPRDLALLAPDPEGNVLPGLEASDGGILLDVFESEHCRDRERHPIKGPIMKDVATKLE